MLLNRQALLSLLAFIWFISNADAAFIGKNVNPKFSGHITGQFSNIVIDKTANRLQVVEHDVTFQDKTESELISLVSWVLLIVSFVCKDVDDTEEENSSSSESDEYSDLSDDYGQRNKRQAEYEDMMNEGAGHQDEVQNIWQGMVQTMVDGGKQILQTIVKSFDNATEQQSENVK